MFLHSALPLSVLRACADKSLRKDIDDPSSPGKLASKVLHRLSKDVGHHGVAKLWRDANLQWTAFVPEDQVSAFLADNVSYFRNLPASHCFGPG